MLCIHNIELNLFPWKIIANMLVGSGMYEMLQIPFIIAGKLLVDLLGAYVLSKIVFVRKLFGYRN